MTILVIEPVTAAEVRAERELRALYRDSEREGVTQEIWPEAKGEWYLIRTEPGRDLTAMNWLSRRRFGVFLPMKGLRRVLPGWLCAYVFDVAAMKPRILACPGVVGILRAPNGIPLKLNITFIRKLANEAWIGKPLPQPRRSDAKKNKAAQRKMAGQAAKRMKKLKRAMKQAEKFGKLSRALDIRAQIMALRQKFSAPQGVAA